MSDPIVPVPIYSPPEDANMALPKPGVTYRIVNCDFETCLSIPSTIARFDDPLALRTTQEDSNARQQVNCRKDLSDIAVCLLSLSLKWTFEKEDSNASNPHFIVRNLKRTDILLGLPSPNSSTPVTTLVCQAEDVANPLILQPVIGTKWWQLR